MHDFRRDRMVWIDLEMTGLDPQECTILEIATIVTDSHLTVIATGPNLAIHQPDEILDGMDEWNTSHHGASGLTERVRASDVDMADAEEQTLAFIRKHVDPNVAPLCGNSISQDRRFLRAYMPRLEQYLHYRNVDVSSIKELVKRWYPADMRAPSKQAAHLALEDIRESIEELRYYRDAIFVDPPE